MNPQSPDLTPHEISQAAGIAMGWLTEHAAALIGTRRPVDLFREQQRQEDRLRAAIHDARTWADLDAWAQDLLLESGAVKYVIDRRRKG